MSAPREHNFCARTEVGLKLVKFYLIPDMCYNFGIHLPNLPKWWSKVGVHKIG